MEHQGKEMVVKVCDIATWVVWLLGFIFYLRQVKRAPGVLSRKKKKKRRLEGNINQVYNIFKLVDKEERKKYPEMFF